jgi:nucleotide-binding universal stress UspA family protein
MDPKRIKRIVVATDFSDLSQEAIQTAVALARDWGATLDLVHVASELSYAIPPPMDVMSLPLDMAAVLRDASKHMSDVEDRVRQQGVTCESAVLVGRADTEIVDHANQTHADLIVLGTHGRHGLPHALLGSVAEKVVQHAHCPVLTIPRHAAAEATT